MPWTDSNVNQTFTVTKAHGRQTLLAAGIQCNGSGLEKPRAERFRQRVRKGFRERAREALDIRSTAEEGCGQPSH
ncbi:MAG TPA: hypothetical protein VFX10_02065 [Nitrospira sp.]|nr:hypothetical protein [Nitrospira sp.]